MMNVMNPISPAHILKGLSYGDYLALVERLFAEGKSTTRDGHESLVQYTGLNIARMHRAYKTTQILPEVASAFQSLPEPQIWVVLSEGWCGDASQNVPILAKIAEASQGNIELKILLRDQNPEIMDAYLTNGGRSIPKLIALRKSDLEELFTWGPRPSACQPLLAEYKAGITTHDEFALKVQAWYNKDKGQTLQKEMRDMAENAAG